MRARDLARLGPPIFFLTTAACALPGTGGELVEIDWVFQSEVAEGPVVVETVGPEPWSVELLEATLLVGPMYAFAPPVVAWDVRDLLRPGRARAHAGDDNTEGVKVLSELLDQVSVDLLDPTPRALARTTAEAGEVATLNVVFDEARFELADETGPTHGGHAWLRGVARRVVDGAPQEVRFSAVLRDTVPDDRVARRLESLPVDGAAVGQSARLEVSADPRAWARRMRFDAYVGAEGEVFVAEPSQIHNAWYLGLRDPTAWRARVVRPDAPNGGVQ